MNTTEKITRLRFLIDKFFVNNTIPTLKVEMIEDPEWLNYIIQASIYTVKHPSKEVSVPVRWWDHFKHDCFPGWLKKRFPPKMKTIQCYNICHHLVNEPKASHVYYLMGKEDFSNEEAYKD